MPAAKKRSARTPRALPHEILLRATVRDLTPEIWRGLLVPDHYTLQQLHRVLQLSFGWRDAHLYEFSIAGIKYSEPFEDSEGEDARVTPLSTLPLVDGTSFLYEYDFGDDWHVDLHVEGRMPHAEGRDRLPYLLGGERAGPPDDCGGLPGYMELVKVLGDPEHPEHESLRDWVGPDYDPELFDVYAVGNAITLSAAWGRV